MKKRGPKRQERCRNGHLMTPNNRRMKIIYLADGLPLSVSAGCRLCNAARRALTSAATNLARKLRYAKD